MLERLKEPTPEKSCSERDLEIEEFYELLSTMSDEDRKNRGLFRKIGDKINGAIRSKRIESFVGIMFDHCDKLRSYEQRFNNYTQGINRKRLTMMEYLETLIILEQLENSLTQTESSFSTEINALDVGAGQNWFYAEALYNFLQNYQTGSPRKVNLRGIDPLATKRNIKKLSERVRNPNITLEQNSILNLNGDKYDFIFMRYMLTDDPHFRSFGLEPVKITDILQKCSSSSSKEGRQVIIGPLAAGEYQAIVENIPVEKRVAEFNYAPDLGDERLNELVTRGLMRTYSEGLCLVKS